MTHSMYSRLSLSLFLAHMTIASPSLAQSPLKDLQALSAKLGELNDALRTSIGVTSPTPQEAVVRLLGEIPKNYEVRPGDVFERSDGSAISSGFTFSLVQRAQNLQIWMRAEKLTRNERAVSPLYRWYANFWLHEEGGRKERIWIRSNLSYENPRALFIDGHYPTITGFGAFPVIIAAERATKQPDVLDHVGYVNSWLLLPLANGTTVTMWTVNGYSKDADNTALRTLAQKYADELIRIVNATKLREIALPDAKHIVLLNR